MKPIAVGHGPQRIHDRPVHAGKPAGKSAQAAPSPEPAVETSPAETRYARDVDMRRRLDDARPDDARSLAKEFKQLSKQLGRAVLAEGREQGLDPEQMKALRTAVKDYRFAAKEALWHDHGRRDGHDAPRTALEVVEANVQALETFAADLAALTAAPVEEPVVEPGPEPVKPDPVEIESIA